MTAGRTDVRIVVDGRETTVHPGEVASLGRDPSSTVVLEDDTVSRRHAVLHLDEAGWELADAGSTNGTWLQDERITRLTIDRPVEVRLGTPTEGVTVMLRPSEPASEVDEPSTDATAAVPVVEQSRDRVDAPTPAPVQAAAMADAVVGGSMAGVLQCNVCGAYSPVDTEWCQCGAYLPHDGVVIGQAAQTSVALTLGDDAVAVDPGETAELTLTLHNTGGVVDRFTLRVDGLPSAWTTPDPESLSLFPGSSASARLTFRPPRAPSPAAGACPFTVVAVSHTDEQVRVSDEASIEVLPFHDLDIRLVPEVSQIVPDIAPDRHGADHHLEIENNGNCPVTLTLEARDPAEALSFAFRPPNPRVDPGGTARIPMEVTLRSPADDEGTAATYPFQVTLRPDAGDDVTLDGRLTREAPEIEIPPPAPPPKPVVVKNKAGKGWRPEIHPLAIIGGVLLVLGAGLDWTTGVDGNGVPFAFLVDGTSTAGPAVGPLLALGGMAAVALSLFRRTAGLRRLVGLAALVVVGLFAFQVVNLEQPEEVIDILGLFREGAYATAVGGILLVLST
jgi:hypothetical protein